MRTFLAILLGAATLSMLSCKTQEMVEINEERSDEVAVIGRFIIASTGLPYWVDRSGRDPDPTSDWPVHVYGLLESGEEVSLGVAIHLDRDGRFRVERIPTSVQTLEFHSNHTLKTFVPFDAATASSEGEAELGDVKLDYGQSIHVKVVGPNGEAVRRAGLRLSRIGDDPTDRADTTNEHGEYTFSGFRAGPAQLTAYAHRDRGNEWVNNRNYSADGKTDVITIDVVIQDSPVTDIVVRFSESSR